jgi:hypothetical protein
MATNPTVPMTLYERPDPEDEVSELYTIYADELPTATDGQKRWVVNELHGYWDEHEPDPKKRFKNAVTTLSPTDPKHCVTIEDAWKIMKQQVFHRSKSGFKYMRMLNMLGPPHKLYEVMADGRYREMPLP